MTELKQSNCDKTKKTQTVTKLKKTNCDKTQKLKFYGSNSDSGDSSSYRELFK